MSVETDDVAVYSKPLTEARLKSNCVMSLATLENNSLIEKVCA